MDGGDPVRQSMSREPLGLGSACIYVGEVPDTRPPSHYTPRVVPHHALARVPLEAPWILWQDRRRA
jgi:starch phosphorylase